MVETALRAPHHEGKPNPSAACRIRAWLASELQRLGATADARGDAMVFLI